MTPNSPSTLQLVCTDFDGTIHLEGTHPPVGTEFQELIAKLQSEGVRWVINTGRDLSSLMEEMARSRLSVKPDYVVVVEREIYRHDGACYLSHHAWNDRCTRIHEQLFARLRHELPPLFSWINENFGASVFEDAWSPFCLVASNLDESMAIVRRFEEWAKAWPEVTVVRNDVYARLSHVEYNKGTALREVARLCGSDADRTFVAGDHVNDLPMLRPDLARWLMAPGNCVEEVRAAVEHAGGWVAPHKASEAVAEGLRRCLLRGALVDKQ
ncbi:MAG TPA: hypothetical protein DCY13_08775 [Verrucomicrobiales bacterium]|nr:hypothetical protein [Verrucomicrobiales bacterium]